MSVTDLIPWSRSRSQVARRDDPENRFFTLHREINRLFDDLWRDFDAPLWRGFDAPSAGFSDGFGWPKVDIVENDKTITVMAELSGMDEKDLEVLFKDDVLTLRGEKKLQTNGGDRHVSELFQGRFERRIGIDSVIDADKISASFRNGLLTVILPKSPDTDRSTRRIPISR
jgi:HSP20 family protein